MKQFLLLILVIINSFSALAQNSRSTLEAEKKRNLERINEVKKALNQTEKEKKTSLNQAKLLQQQISNQESKIGLAQRDYDLIQAEMSLNIITQDSLREKLSSMQKEYAEIIVREAKTSGKLTKIGFLFSSASLTDLFMRYKYLQQYSANRKEKFEKIKLLNTTLQNRQVDLANGKVRQAAVIKEVSDDKKDLDVLKQKQDKVVKELTSKAGQLRTELKKEQAALRQLNSVITVAIAREKAARKAEEEAKAKEAARIRAAELAAKREAERKEATRLRAEEAAKRTAEKSRPEEGITKVEETPVVTKKEEVARPVVKAETPAVISTRTEVATVATGKFSAAKNKLAWPVSGFISGKFGVNDHPVLAGIKVVNNGVDIRTSHGAAVRAVFEGVVMDISEIPGLNHVIAIQHGDYYTVYANLASVSVRVNQKVSGREVIGTAAEKEGNSEINFQVWHNFNKLNPEAWLGNK